MTAGTERVVLTFEDFMDMPEDGNRYEIIDGEVYVTPPPSVDHQNVVVVLSFFLTGHVRQRRLGRILVAPCGVRLSDTVIPEPDLLFVSRERERIIRRDVVWGPPDLVVEVLSPTTARRDLGLKKQTYAEFDIPNYWLVDPIRRDMLAFALRDGAYQQVASASDEESFSAPPFPDLVIPLGELWL